jgi:hypothetical protein
LVIGLVTGLTSLRDALVTELADLGDSIGSLDQSYTIPGVVGPNGTTTASSSFTDQPDTGDTADAANCILVLGSAPVGEGGEHLSAP